MKQVNFCTNTFIARLYISNAAQYACHTHLILFKKDYRVHYMVTVSCAVYQRGVQY